VGGQRWWPAAGSVSLGPTTRDHNGAGLRWRAEGGGFRRRRWGFGNGAFAAYAYPSPRKSVPVAPWADALGALLAAENARSDVSLWTDEELWAVRRRAGLPIWCALTRSHLVLAAVCRLERTPEGQNAGLPSLSPARLVSIVPATLELPLVRR
jgi:hypothetical protein